jgi:hypothetical protein
MVLTALSMTSVSIPAFGAEPTTGQCLAANENSIALKNQHKLRAARTELLVCAASSCPADIRNECARRVAEVNAALPTIVFEAKDGSGNDVTAVKVTVDGQPLADRLEGTALSIDPGPHSFVFETPGQPPVTRQFVVQEGAKGRREQVVFGAAAPAAAAGPPPPASGTPAFAPSPELSTNGSTAPAAVPPDSGTPGATQRIIGWTGVGVGAVAVGLGVFFEAQRGSKVSERDAICPSGVDCAPGTQASIDALTEDAKSAATLGAISLIGGGVLVAGGIALVLTAPKSSGVATVGVAPALAPNFQGVALSCRTW